MEDERFKTISQDPRFKRMPKAERKVKIDRRFEGMFKDKRFKLKYSVDKRGRPLNATTDDNLRRFYEMSESESDNESSEDEQLQAKKKLTKHKGKADGSKNVKADVNSRTKAKNSKSVSTKKLGHLQVEDDKTRTSKNNKIGSNLKSLKKQKETKSLRTEKKEKGKTSAIKSTSLQKKKTTLNDSDEEMSDGKKNLQLLVCPIHLPSSHPIRMHM